MSIMKIRLYIGSFYLIRGTLHFFSFFSFFVIFESMNGNRKKKYHNREIENIKLPRLKIMEQINCFLLTVKTQCLKMSESQKKKLNVKMLNENIELKGYPWKFKLPE